MNIKLEHLMPHPLAKMKHGENSIWGNSIFLEAGKKILLNASSGKGKSTFSSTVYGLRRDYDGMVYYDEQDIKSLSLDDWAEIRATKIAIVFQNLQLFPKLTVKENLIIKSQLTHKKTENELFEELKMLGIEEFWNQPCGLLSMGQQQRVAIVRALSQPFDWLLLDEPFSHLDKENTQICLKMIVEETEKESAGFVLTTLGDHYDFQFDQEFNL